MARRRRAIRPTKPMPNRDKVAGSGVATDVAEKLTLSRSAPILPGVLLVKTRAAVVGAPTIMVSFTMPLLTSELARLKVWVNKEPSVTVVDVIRPRCEPMRSKLSLYVPGARDITAELICPAAPGAAIHIQAVPRCGCHAETAEECSAHDVYGATGDGE